MAHEQSGVAVLSQGRAAVYEEPIGPAGVRIRDRARTEPRPGSVAVAIRAASINHLDLWLAHGAQRIAPPRVIGGDGAGVVHASGDPAWKPGDEVVLFPTLCDWECEWCRAGENVRCPHFGVLGEHADGADAVFDSGSFSKAVRDVTNDGVDVVFEHVGPATLEESMRSLAMGGRIVTCGSTSGVKAEVTMPRLFFRQASLLGSTMGNASEFEALLGAIDRGLRPVVDSVYPLDEVQAALTRLDAAEQFGKVVLSVSS